jgi:ABC-2 type transport system permease protein
VTALAQDAPAPGRAGSRKPAALAGFGELGKLAGRRDRVMLPAWIYLLTVAMVGTGYSFKTGYKTAASRAAVYATTAHDAALTALAGPIFGSSVGALTAWKYGGASAALAALMSIFIVTRHTRGDEEAGRLELVGSTTVGRHTALAVGLALAAAASCLLAVLIAAGLAVVGLPATGSVAIGLAVASCGLVFAAVAGVTAQLAGSARGARGSAIGLLVTVYVLQSVAASAAGLHWLGWLSPVYWAEQVRAFAGDRWAVLALPLACTAVIAIVAPVLESRRDVGAGLVQPRPGPAAAGRTLRSPLALAWRLQHGSFIGWAVGTLLLGVAVGSVAKGIGSMLGSGKGIREAVTRLGGQAGLSDAYLAAIMSLVGLAAAGYAISAVLRLRSDEAAGRADPLLATAMGRIGWSASQLVVAAAGAAIVLAAAGLGAGISYGSQVGGIGVQLPRLLGAALAQLPAVLVLAGVAVLLVGMLPRICVGAAWAALAVVALLVLLGPTLRLAQWVQDISPFSHVPRLPGGTVSAAPLIWLSVIAVALAAAGLAGLRRRDIG